MLLIVLGSACGTNPPVPASAIPHCQTEDEWRFGGHVARQVTELADLPDGPYNEFIDYYDYLTSVCHGINKARDE